MQRLIRGASILDILNAKIVSTAPNALPELAEQGRWYLLDDATSMFK
jgi:hypothetical protein